jgi:hypothetical protein
MRVSTALSLLALLGGAAHTTDAFDYEIVYAGDINLIDAATGIVGE